jgi:hypothetical protein
MKDVGTVKLNGRVLDRQSTDEVVMSSIGHKSRNLIRSTRQAEGMSNSNSSLSLAVKIVLGKLKIEYKN